MGLYDDIDKQVLTTNAVSTINDTNNKGLFDDIDNQVQQVKKPTSSLSTLDGFTPDFGEDRPLNKPKTFAENHPILASTPEALKQLGTRSVKSFPEFGKGVNDLVALVGDKTGLQGISDFGRSNAQFWQEQSDKIQIDPKYQGIKGLQSKETVLPTILGSIGDQATNLLMAGGGGGLGAKTATSLGLKGAAKAGLITAGTSIPNLAQEGQYLDKIETFKNVYGRVPTAEELKQIQNTALGEKAINTALETVSDRLLFGKMFPQGAITKDVRGIIKNAGQQALTEAATEGIQEGVSIGAENLIGINQGNNLERLADSMAIGGITGGVMGGVTSAAAQPYNTQFPETQNVVNPMEAVKNVSAQLLDNGKVLYNSAADNIANAANEINNLTNTPDTFDTLRTLSKDGAFSNKKREEIAPNTAKKLKEQQTINNSTDSAVENTSIPSLVENETTNIANEGEIENTAKRVQAEKTGEEATAVLEKPSSRKGRKAAAKAAAIERIKAIAPNTAKQMETSTNFVKDNDGVYEKVGENQLRNVDTNEVFTPANPEQYSEWRHDPSELITVKEFKYDAKSKHNADNYAYSKQNVVNAYNNYIKNPTEANAETYQEAYGKATEEYSQKEESFKKNDKLTQIAPKTVAKMQKENQIVQESGMVNNAVKGQENPIMAGNMLNNTVESEVENEYLEPNTERRQSISNENEKAETGIGRTEKEQSGTSEILRGDGQQELRQSELPSGTGISQKDLETINKSYKNQHELNKAIEDYVNNEEYRKYPGSVRMPQEIKDWLKKYTGAGGLEKQGAEGKGLLSEYYTPQNVVNKMWELTEQYVNTDGAKVLEPSVGIGRFLENAPKNTSFDVFEMNPVTAKITKILYPDANVETGEFQKKFIDPSKNLPVKSVSPEYDIVIGNPPYGKYNSKFKGLGEGAKYEQLESYFINRGLDTLKDNGILTYVVPSSFLRGQKGKLEIANKCELLDAYRLPNGTFGTTDIGTDIIVLRKRSGKTDTKLFGDSWFKSHPEKILGEVQKGKGNWGTDLVKGDKNAVDNIKVGEKDIKETVAKDTNVSSKKSSAKNIKKTTPKKNLPAQKGKIEYTEYKHDNRATEREMELWEHTTVDGSLDGNFKAGEDINQYQGKLYNDFNYLQGDIYEKLEVLERENISEKQKERQRNKLLSVLPKEKQAKDIRFNPTSDFIQDFEIENAEEVRWGKKKSPLVQGFIDYINQIPSDYRDDFSSRNIEAYLTGSRIDFRIKFSSKSPEYAREKSKKMSKLKAIVEKHFTNYVAKVLDKDTRDRLVKEWNRNFNNTYNPDYTKMPLLVRGLNSKFKGGDLKLKETQIEGINFLANKGVGLIGFEVGVGKTLTGIISTVQNMQMGRCKRPLIIIPKNIKKNWKEEFAETFPNIKVIDVDNMSKWDGVVEDGTVTLATYQALDNLWYNKSDAELTDMIYQLGNNFDKETTKRGKESVKERFENMVGKALKGNKAKFKVEDLGFDHVTFDEAHAGKNLFDEARADSMEKDAGGKSVGSNTYFNMRGGSQSKVALRMFLLTQHILKENNNRNVFMLTATPFNNQSLEVFNMLSYLAKDKLDKMGLYNVYQFNEQFIDVTSDIVLDANNNPVEKQVELGFKNVGALREIIKSCMLIRTADEANVVRPNKIVTRQKLDATEEQLYWFDQADEMAMNRDIDGALFKSISMRRNATISPDVAANNYDVSPENFIKNSPKLDYIMRCVESMKNKDAKTSQIIYMPIGVKFLGKIKQYLVDKGVYKPEEIEIISSENALSNPEKEEARLSKITDSFNDREGDVKLIIGTQKIQVGMNLNKNTSTLYMPYVEWNPTDFVQTVGRMWRQGNSNKNVRVVVPLLKNSSDSFMFQKLDEKIKRMNDLMGSDKEYINNDDLQTEEEKIAMISNPSKRAKMYTLLEKDKIEFEIKKLEARKRTAQDYKLNLERTKGNLEYHEKEISKLEKQQEENGELSLYQQERLKDHKKSLAYNKRAIDSINAQIELDNIDFDGKDSEESIDMQIEEQKKELEKLNEIEQQKAAEYSVEYDNERRNIKSIDEHIAEFEREYDELYSYDGEDSFGDIVEKVGEFKDRFNAAISAIKGKKIKDLVKNNEVIKFFENELRDVQEYTVAEMPESMKAGILYGKHIPEQKTIFLNMDVIGDNVEQFINTFMHEVEHAKQYKEYLKVLTKRYKTKTEQEIVDDYLYCKNVNKNKNTYYNKHRQVLTEIQQETKYLSTQEELQSYLNNLSGEKRKVYNEYKALFEEYYAANNEVKARNAGGKAVERFKNVQTNRSGHQTLGVRQKWDVRAGSWGSSKGVKRGISKMPRRIRSSELESESSEAPIGLSSFRKETSKTELTNEEKAEKADVNKETAHEINQVAREEVYNWFNNIESDRYDIDKTLNSFVNLTKAKAVELSKNLGFKVSDVQVREIMPFLRERTEFPKSLNRDDLRKIFNSLSENDKKNLTQLADTTSEKFEKYYQNYNKVKGTPDNEGIENHISHLWKEKDRKKSLLTNYITTNSRFAKRRTIGTLVEGIDGIEIDGEIVTFEPRTLDYAEILKSSSDNLVKATHDSILAEAVKNLKYKGKPLVLPATKAPSEWVEVNHPALSKAIYKGSVGEDQLPILIKTPVKVHPEIADYVGSIFEVQNNSKFWDKYDSINGMVKQLLLGFSGFHGYALSESAIGNMGLSKTLKELNPKKFVEAIKNGKYDIYENEEYAKRAIKAGVKLGTPSDLQRNLTEQALKQIPVVGKALSSVVSANNIILWNVLHNNFKIVAFNSKIEEIEKANGKVSTEEERATAQWVNDSFGGQAWELLGIKPSSVKTASRVLLSPDWNFSTLRQAVASLNTAKTDKTINSNVIPMQAKRLSHFVGLTENADSNGTRGKVGRAFWLRSALYFTVFYNLINAAFREKDREKYPHLYPKEMSPFDYSIWSNSYPMDNVYDRLMPKVFIGRNSDGSARMLRVGKQFREVPEFLAEPLTKISGKTSPVMNIISQVGFGMSPGDAVNRLMGKDAYLNQDIWDGFGTNASMKTGSDLVRGRIKTLGKSLTPFIMSKHISGKHEFSAWDFFAQTGVGATKSKVYKQAKAAFEAGETNRLQEIRVHAQKDGLKLSDINAMIKYAETSYKADNTRKYKRQYVSAMENKDNKKIQQITDKMRKNKLSVAETKRIYNNAYKDYMKELYK